MLAALIIVFREVFEAGLIVGIVMAATRAVPYRSRWIAAGVGGGVLGACLIALFTRSLSAALEGMGQELFNAAILGIAAIMLAWHNVFMARHGRALATEMHQAGEAVESGAKSLAALALVVGIAVLREGAEVVLFLFGVAASESESSMRIFAGGAAGLGLGVAVCLATYFGLLAIPSRLLFAVTSWLIAFLAAGMAAQAITYLERADVVTALGTVVWDSSWLLSEKSWPGRALHTLIGYSDRPTAIELLVYIASLALIFALMRLCASPRASASPMPGDKHAKPQAI